MSEENEVTITTPPTGVMPPEPAPKPYAGPEYIPEKFRTAEDPAKAMAEAYAELEKKLSGTPKPETPKPGDQTPNPDKPKEGEAPKPGDTPTDVGLTKFFQEFESNGALSDESYAELEQKGFSRDVVDAYVEGQAAIAAQRGAELKASAGGAEVYDAMIQWGAAGGLTEAEMNAYDAVLAKGDMAAAKIMASALVAKYNAANGVQPQRTVTATVPGATTGAYESFDQMMSDMNDPRYRTDAAFRAQVAKKAQNSTAF